MALTREQRRKIQYDLSRELYFDRLDVTLLASIHRVSRQTIYKYLQQWLQKGYLTKTAQGKYQLKRETHSVMLKNEQLDESLVWSQLIKEKVAEFPRDIRDRFQYVFTEMLNNAIEHSESSQIVVNLAVNALGIQCRIGDDGVGIFSKIQQALGLEEKRFALLELAKGKFTSDPQHHTGEGIFFSSRVADIFSIHSDELVFSHFPGDIDELADDQDPHPGTAVSITLFTLSDIKINEVFHMYEEHPEYVAFSKTSVPVRLLEYGEENPVFVSRSEARRLLARFEKFHYIVLDFAGVEDIRQGFADEVFRVFPAEHPEIEITTENCNENVQRMIDHVRQTK